MQTDIISENAIYSNEINDYVNKFKLKIKNALIMEFPELKERICNVIDECSDEFNTTKDRSKHAKITKKQDSKKTKRKTKKAQVKTSIPIPFYGHVVEDWCCGIRKNHGLYTQCQKAKTEGSDYCKICLNQSKNNATKKRKSNT